jgi:hypothetical protein
MDDLDRFILEAELKDGWRAVSIHEIQRDQPNRCRTYVARNPSGDMGFVKVLPPRVAKILNFFKELEREFESRFPLHV